MASSRRYITRRDAVPGCDRTGLTGGAASVTAGCEIRRLGGGEGSISTPQARQVQVFGTKKSADTRKALRFFSERRVVTHFVDFQERAPALGELRRFAERFGAPSLVDRASRRFLDLGLQRSMHSDDWWLRKLAEDPGLLKQPLVRFGHKVSVGLDEAVWREWLA